MAIIDAYAPSIWSGINQLLLVYAIVPPLPSIKFVHPAQVLPMASKQPTQLHALVQLVGLGAPQAIFASAIVILAAALQFQILPFQLRRRIVNLVALST